ncbi:MAG TPA: adenosylcobinamide-GDP ribazoletransferase, partial [Ktedonobacterales bacterium]|nr:adenosylcobinamide-GDP ribazoletransferase [Ktedonobacterales bacterium]
MTPSHADAPDMGRALPWFPLVGALLGAILVLVDWALTPLLSLGVRDALLLALAALMTGMLHLDGFVDCCDGLLGARSVERRLEIMRDSRVGAYGALGAALLL